MPQVVSKAITNSDGDQGQLGSPSPPPTITSSTSNLIDRPMLTSARSSSSSSSSSSWKRPLTIVFHGAAASIYGFAICWQTVSEASYQLYLRSNPLVRIYGRWRFLTYNCLVMQFVAFSLCFTAHFVPKLRRTRDFFFTSLAFPISILVVSTFWGVWFTFGRELIFPVNIEAYYPPWLNHITHTIIAPINLIELFCIKKQYSSDKKALVALGAYSLTYTSYLMYIRLQTGKFVYPILNHLSGPTTGVFIASLVVMVVCVYKSGKYLHDCAHGLRSSWSKGKMNNSTVGGKNSKKKH